ncbi:MULTISPECIES: hypothetical protein [unclassified Mesorhizobium]|uniref:hypothetical protein n=1 Tax=unclassified Mesorhizobium TaxID=325217 RepID=UPI0003CE6AD8|nr:MULTISPECIES: hypothetical protein [unclassified Mesorhizobium]ESY56583.1 hypothetical protein X745_05945 [Mesorhizobium sp. LNJC374B00]ESY61314.1 hypothetical protein X744_06255 [Mesorhizobium sp. LNJC372A00]WJI80836.1 hypothetical protein NLY34_29160 [Mesorhizobium sp. C374B]WJI87375.1 hypothetical protein NLY42_31555 [Mesorhizobium sp. C372A]
MAENGAIAKAALWLATGDRDKNRAAVPQLREKFGLSAADAVAALRESRLILARSL